MKRLLTKVLAGIALATTLSACGEKQTSESNNTCSNWTEKGDIAYVTESSKQYHQDAECSYLKNEPAGTTTITGALRLGKKACPDCIEVFTTEENHYFHHDKNCDLICKKQKLECGPRVEARKNKKGPCRACTFVYVTNSKGKKGLFYHEDKHCDFIEGLLPQKVKLRSAMDMKLHACKCFEYGNGKN